MIYTHYPFLDWRGEQRKEAKTRAKERTKNAGGKNQNAERSRHSTKQPPRRAGKSVSVCLSVCRFWKTDNKGETNRNTPVSGQHGPTRPWNKKGPIKKPCGHDARLSLPHPLPLPPLHRRNKKYCSVRGVGGWAHTRTRRHYSDPTNWLSFRETRSGEHPEQQKTCTPTTKSVANQKSAYRA